MSIRISPSVIPPVSTALSNGQGVHQRQKKTALLRLRYTILVGIIVSILFPMAIRQVTTGIPFFQATQYNTALGGTFALILGVLGYRRLHIFPGISAGSYIFISLTTTFAVLAVTFFMMRIDYSRLQFLSSYVLSLAAYLYINQKVALRGRLRVGVVPSAKTLDLPLFENVDWLLLEAQNEKNGTPEPLDAVVVDLRADHDDFWDAQITRYALRATPVYHFKQVIEQLSGRVEIEHLSENTLGSLNPNDVYLKIKSIFDISIASILLVLLLPVMVLTALLVKLDSPGPAIFRQKRMGYRGQPFTIYKMRTMRVNVPGKPASDDEALQSAMTQVSDPRITRFGQFLRRSRLDELPQLLNIVKGEMSLIGPRPEALPLSQWYEAEIPFYHYRHLIKPGVTGWAQINQGHVTDVADVREKLHLDFYYVKNLSFWLDVLICVRTLRTMVSGNGAR
ncbi:exopolysaccharide biosynthesis polyprenyl glycosylphosphotransferase [Sphingomonas hankookensis]